MRSQWEVTFGARSWWTWARYMRVRICPYHPILSPHWAWPVSPVALPVRDQICEQHRGQAVARGEAELVLWGWTIMGEGFRQTYTGESRRVFPGVEIAWPSTPLPCFSLLLENRTQRNELTCSRSHGLGRTPRKSLCHHIASLAMQ